MHDWRMCAGNPAGGSGTETMVYSLAVLGPLSHLFSLKRTDGGLGHVEQRERHDLWAATASGTRASCVKLHLPGYKPIRCPWARTLLPSRRSRARRASTVAASLGHTMPMASPGWYAPSGGSAKRTANVRFIAVGDVRQRAAVIATRQGLQ